MTQMMPQTQGLQTDWLERWALHSPESPALTDYDRGRSYTYKQCHQIVQGLAARLSQEFGLRRGDRVALLARNEIESILLFFALHRLGALLAPLNFRLTPSELKALISDASVQLLVYEEEFKNSVEQLPSETRPRHQLGFHGPNSLMSLVEDSLKSAVDFPHLGQFDDPCMILYTAGTTGQPKGVVLSHRALFWNSINTGLRLNLTSQDKALIFLPLFHTGGWNVLTTPFLHHGAHILLSQKFDPEQILRACAEESLTVLFGVPTTMERLSESPSFASVDLSSVRYAVVGGEPMSLKNIETWHNKGIPIRQGYGLTECGPGLFSLHERDSMRKIGSIGQPNFYVETRVVTDEGQNAPQEEMGELWVRGPMQMDGYWHNPKATAEALENGWLKTGDLVKVDPEGYYYIVGRKKEMYISGGENVFPAEVEAAISRLEGVREVAVVGVPHEKWGESGRAFISLSTSAKLNEAAVLAHCEKHLAKYKVPSKVDFVDELPKGDSGKILKKVLLQQIRQEAKGEQTESESV